MENEPIPLTKTKTAQAGADKRVYKRFPVVVEVSYSSEHNFYTGFIRNISSGGLFVATAAPLHIGERMELSFHIPGADAACVVHGIVKWMIPYDPLNTETSPGMGVQFIDLNQETQTIIDSFLKLREPLFYDDE